MIELPRRGYGYVAPTYVAATEIAAVTTRSKHSMDDYNTTVVTLKSGATFDTSLTPQQVRDLVRSAT